MVNVNVTPSAIVCPLDIAIVTPSASTLDTVTVPEIPVPVIVAPTDIPGLAAVITIVPALLIAPSNTEVVVGAALHVPTNINAPVVASFNCCTFTASVFAVPAVRPDILPVTATPALVVSNFLTLL